MIMCSRCRKRIAVVFVTKVENNQKNSEGLCLHCAKELGLPIENMMGGALGKMGMSADQLADMEDEVNQMIANGDMPTDEEGNHVEGGAPAIDFQKLMRESGLFSQSDSNVQAREDSVRSGRRMNHSHVLLLLSHIRLCMIRQPDMPLFYSNLLSRISDSIGMSVRNITKSLKILEELNIIHSEELPRYKDSNGQWHSNVKIFVNMKIEECDYNWQDEVARGIRCIMASQID